MNNKALRVIGILGALAVILGAFGAHGLKAQISPAQLSSYQTGIAYHLYHVLAMVGIVALSGKFSPKFLNLAFWAFFVGILLFSGSIYLLACKDIFGLGGFVKVLGPVTPLGGLCFIFGWIMLILASQKKIE